MCLRTHTWRSRKNPAPFIFQKSSSQKEYYSYDYCFSFTLLLPTLPLRIPHRSCSEAYLLRGSQVLFLNYLLWWSYQLHLLICDCYYSTHDKILHSTILQYLIFSLPHILCNTYLFPCSETGLKTPSHWL